MQLYDYQLDLIDRVRAAWSAGKRAVCVKQIWDEALHMPYPPTRRDSAEISQLMQQFPEWMKRQNSIRVPGFGKQKVWEKKEPIELIEWEDIDSR